MKVRDKSKLKSKEKTNAEINSLQQQKDFLATILGVNDSVASASSTTTTS